MTNKEWLDYLAHNVPDELAAWFDAEHVENQERALDGDTAALNAKIAELELQLEEHREGWNHAIDGWQKAGKRVDELLTHMEKLTAERERYRSKFGKCLDYADAIHALMDDEGMA